MSDLKRRTLFKGGTILSMDKKAPYIGTADLLVEGDKIAAVGRNLALGDAAVVDASNSIVMPRLIDAHHHMWLGVMRRLLPNVRDLLAYIDFVAEGMGAHYRPFDMYLSTKLTALACLDACDLAKLGPEFAEAGVLGPHNIFNHCTRVRQETWRLFADAGVNVTINPRSDALFGFDDESFWNPAIFQPT